MNPNGGYQDPYSAIDATAPLIKEAPKTAGSNFYKGKK